MLTCDDIITKKYTLYCINRTVFLLLENVQNKLGYFNQSWLFSHQNINKKKEGGEFIGLKEYFFFFFIKFAR